MPGRFTSPRGPERHRTLGQLGRPRFEVLPLPGIVGAVLEHLPDDAIVTVTASPRLGLDATVGTAVSLALRGMDVVPHLSARLIPDEGALKTTLDTLTTSGVSEVFVIGGDAAEPVGEYTSALDILPAVSQLDHGLRIGVAGYPEPHPLIDDDVLVRALRDKSPYASYVVSQMCFDARTLLTWVHDLRRRGVDLPVLVGVPGPVSVSRLLRIVAKVGVGDSARVVRKHRGALRHLASPVPWQPNQLLHDLAPGFADPGLRLGGVHVYTFNDVHAAGRWWREASRGDQRATGALGL